MSKLRLTRKLEQQMIDLHLLFDQLFNEHSINARHALKATDNTSKPVRPRIFQRTEFIYYECISFAKIVQTLRLERCFLALFFKRPTRFTLNITLFELFFPIRCFFMLCNTQLHLHLALIIQIKHQRNNGNALLGNFTN